MAITDYIPHNDAELLLWLTNLSTKVNTNAAALGLSGADVTLVQGWCTSITNSVKAAEVAKTAAKTAVAAKNDAIALNVNLIRQKVAELKAKISFTDALGKDLDVVGTKVQHDLMLSKPDIKVSTFPGSVRIDFTKKGLDGVNVYMRRKGENDWNKLAFDSQSPYIDNTPLLQNASAEVREYSCIGVKNDDETGQRSDVVVVTYAG